MQSLVLWEFSRKQDYVFRSNKLSECVGASLIIKELTENFKEYSLKEDNFIIKGGGKSLYLFEDEEDAKEFIRNYSFNVLKRYPGLDFFIVMNTFDENQVDIKEIIKNLYIKLEAKKCRRKNSGNQIGFGIEKICDSTGYPATDYKEEDGEIKPISSEIKAKIRASDNKQIKYFEDLIPDEYKFTKLMNDLVKEKAKGYISIVHIDGNGMGKRFKNIENKIIKNNNESFKEFNDRYLDILKKFSKMINEKYNLAFKEMAKAVVSKNNKEKLKEVCNIEKNILPLRPLILAGDDVTFITNGYIGVECARIFIEELNKNNININGLDFGKLNACAGIAIIKKGYPFIKGYDIAEELCQNCKSLIIDRGYNDTSILDFHIAQGDVNKSIKEIREEEYSYNKKFDLTMRPLLLDDTKDWRNYNNFINSIRNVNEAIKNKDIGRNKIKALREILKKGPAEAEYFFKFYKIPGKYLKDLNGTRGDYCFNEKDNICMYLDAIESMDLFIELEN